MECSSAGSGFKLTNTNDALTVDITGKNAATAPVAGPPSIHERFHALAVSDPVGFKEFFRRLSKSFPEQAAEACLLYVAAHGLDETAKSMAYWLSSEKTYIYALLDVDSLPLETAVKAAAIVKDIDPQFQTRFLRATAGLATPGAILRALGLSPVLGDYSVLLPWLRQLSDNPDSHVRSRAVKLLCDLRPDKALVERQMRSNDPRVRAGALEALWQPNIPGATALLRLAVEDTHHRVVGNALIGLYLAGEGDAFNKIEELCSHKDHLFRAAMAYVMGVVKDIRAVPLLQVLSRDKSHMVRKRSLMSLLAIEALTGENEPVRT